MAAPYDLSCPAPYRVAPLRVVPPRCPAVARRFNATARAFVMVNCAVSKRYRHGSRVNGDTRQKSELICE